MTIIYEKDRDRSKVKLRKRWQSQDWRQERWCCMCNEIGKKSFTMSCCRPVKRLILTCQQLERLRQSRENDQNWLIGKVSFSITTTSDPIFLATRQKLRELDWEVLMHLPYNSDLASSNYRLFRSLQNSLNGVKLTSKEACENHLLQFFVQKS